MAYLTDQNDGMSVCLSATVRKLHIKRTKKKKKNSQRRKKRDEERGKETKTPSLSCAYYCKCRCKSTAGIRVQFARITNMSHFCCIKRRYIIFKHVDDIPLVINLTHVCIITCKHEYSLRSIQLPLKSTQQEWHSCSHSTCSKSILVVFDLWLFVRTMIHFVSNSEFNGHPCSMLVPIEIM